MKNSRILLSAITACVLCSANLADDGLNWYNDGTWQPCTDDTCNPNKHNAGKYDENNEVIGANVVIDRHHGQGGGIYGGYGVNGSANDNNITVNGDITFHADVFIKGGKSDNSNASKNRVTINSGTFGDFVTGGESSKGDANENVLILNNGTFNFSIRGGVSTNGNANGNRIELYKGKSLGDINGGRAENGEANNNVVIITDGAKVGTPGKDYGVYGGFSHIGQTHDNNVIISGKGTQVQLASGGYTKTGGSYDNTVIIDDEAEITDRVYGAWANGTGQIDRNKVIIQGEAKVKDVYGGHSTDGSANKNEVHIENSTITTNKIIGGEGKISANDNKIFIKKNADISQVTEITGGKSSAGVANKNEVNIDGDVSAKVTGGDGATGASENIVNIGGNSSGDIIGGQSTNGETNKNQISVNGDVSGNIYAGWDGADAKGNDNTINLQGAVTNVGGAIKVGSKSGSGNTLNINTDNPVTLNGNVGGAQNINFNVGNVAPGGSAVILGSGATFDADGAKVGGEIKVSKDFKEGDGVTLIGGNKAGVKGSPSSINVTATKGGILKFALDIPSLTTMGSSKVIGVASETKTISEGAMGGAIPLTIASDNLANQGISSALKATSATISGATIIAPFGSIMGGSNRVETGSHVSVNGINLAFGAAVGKITDSGKLTIGPFIEFGLSSYTTHNDFGYGDAKGDGDTKYFGAGALLRYDFGGTEKSRAYIEGSARMGKNYNSYENKNLKDGFGNHAKYDMDTNYYGAHIGAGYIYKKDNHSVDVYAKYFYNRLGGDNIDIMNVPYEFDAVKSHRILAGAKYKMEIETNKNVKVEPFVGAAFDYEFKGDGNVYASGFAVDAPSLKGASAMIEAGLTLANNKGFSVDLGARGYAGKRRGINGLLNVNFEF